MVVRPNTNVILSLAASVAVILSACGGQVAASDSGSPIEAACGRLADRTLGVGACGPSIYTPEEIARERPLLAHNCLSVARLPGSVWANPDVIDQCGKDCSGQCAPPGGTLPNGAPCTLYVQCASDNCGGGGTDPAHPACGTCVGGTPIGAPCTGLDCAIGAGCSPTEHVCKAVVTVDEGAACDEDVTFCKDGLFCASGTCLAPPSVVGAPCDSFGCGAKLRCIRGACAPAVAEGGACTADTDCVARSICDPTTSTCTRLRLVGAGESCNLPTVLCAIGACPATSNAHCPALLSLGAACNETDTTSVCDVASRCTNGVCVEDDADACE